MCPSHVRQILSLQRALVDDLLKKIDASALDDADVGALAMELRTLGLATVERAASLLARRGRVLLSTRDARRIVLGKLELDLSRRPALRLIMCALIAAQGRAVLGVSELFGAGWPQSRAAAGSRAARVYVAINTLRKMGLRDVIRRQDHGYVLDEAVTVVPIPDHVVF